MKNVCYNMLKSGVVSAFADLAPNSVISKRRMFMMTRNIRKVVSIVCAVALLLSLCAVSIFSSTSAVINAEDKLQKVYNCQDFRFYDFTEKSGVATWRATDVVEYREDGVYGYNDGNGGGFYLADDPNFNAGNAGGYTPAKDPNYNNTDLIPGQGNKDKLLKLDAGETYRITVNYRYLEGSKKSGFYFKTGADITDPAPNDQFDFIGTTPSNTITVPTGGLTADTPWTEYTAVIKIKDAEQQTNESSTVNFGIKAEMGGTKLLIKNIKIEKVLSITDKLIDINETYTFDFKNTATQNSISTRLDALDSDRQHYSFYNWNNHFNGNSDYMTESYPGEPGFTADGMKFTIGKGATLTEGQAGWACNAIIYDTAVGNSDGWGNAGGYLKLKDKATYLITVKYKATQITGKTQFAVGTMPNATAGEVTPLPGSIVTINETSNDWQYLNVVVENGDSTPYADKILMLCGAVTDNGKWSTVMVDSVTVQEKRLTDTGVAVLKFVDEDSVSYKLTTPGVEVSLDPITSADPDKGFAGWMSGETLVGTKFTPVEGINTLTAKWAYTAANVAMINVDGEKNTVKLAVGLDLPRPVAPAAGVYFLGWYTDLTYTTQVKTVPDHDITLYAKYTGAYLDFDNSSYVETSFAANNIGLVADPDNPTDKVLKLTQSGDSRPNFMLPFGDFIGAGAFELENNSSYTYTIKYKVAAGSDGADMQLNRGDHSHYDPNSTTRSGLVSLGGIPENKTEQSSDWITVTGSFATGKTMYLERVKWSYQNHVFLNFYPGKDKTTTIYIAEIVISKKLEAAPEGYSTISFETNGPGVNSIYGMPGDAVVLPAAPISAGSEFVAWYTDKNLTTPYTGTSFGAEDITLYAKWKSTAFVVDFSDYNKSNPAARAKFVTGEDGNDYLDWWVKYATSNTGDTGTHYRVMLNKSNVHYEVTEGLEYTMTFKYKLLEGTVNIGAVTNGKLNGWADYKDQNTGKGTNVTLSKANPDEWQTASVSFIASPLNKNGTYLSIGIANHGHVLIDDVAVVCNTNVMNLYGSSRVFFNANGGDTVDPISGEPGEAFGTLPTPTRAGYMFNGWFTDEKCETPLTATTYGEEDITLYADWIIGKFSENFEDFPVSVSATGLGGGHKIYNTTNFKDSYDKANVKSGSASLYRDGTSKGTKAFTLCRDTAYALTKGKQYTLTFYVKPTDVTAAEGTIALIGMSNNTTGINSPSSTNVITTVGALKVGEWQQISYTFTASDKYIGIQTTAGNSMYFDNVTVTLKGYTGTTTGDASVNPVFIVMMVVLAAGALIVTGKKIYSK